MIELIKAYGRYDHRLFSMDWSTGSMSYKTPAPKIIVFIKIKNSSKNDIGLFLRING